MVLIKRQDANGTGLTLKLLEKTAQAALLAEQQDLSDAVLDEQVGFRKVLDMLIALKKPIVGHNCFLDLCHVYQKFIEPLPESVIEFKEKMHMLFPTVFDTKFIAARQDKLAQISTTSLQNLIEFFDSSKAQLPLSWSRDLHPQFHDAAWDSLCTGRVFVGLASMQVEYSAANLVFMENVHKQIQKMLIDHEYCNRIFVMNSDLEQLSLDATDGKAHDAASFFS